jgi:hypothetical protein
MDEIHAEGRKSEIRSIGMRPMQVNDIWVKMEVYGFLGDYTGTTYAPYTQGDLNELLCVFINSNKVDFNGVTFTTKNFTKTFEELNNTLGYRANTILNYCKNKKEGHL